MLPALFVKENASRQIYEVSTNTVDYMIYTNITLHQQAQKILHGHLRFHDHCLFMKAKKLMSTDHDKTSEVRKIFRNDPCPCGSGKKYK